MNVNYYIKAAALATLIGLTVYTVKHERKHIDTRPALMKVTEIVVMKVTDVVVMKAHAEEGPVHAPEHKPTLIERAKEKIVLPHHDSPSRTKAADGSGAKWTFPYSCSKVKWYAAHFSQETLEKMRVLAGEPAPSGEQRQQISECLSGKFQ